MTHYTDIDYESFPIADLDLDLHWIQLPNYVLAARLRSPGSFRLFIFWFWVGGHLEVGGDDVAPAGVLVAEWACARANSLSCRRAARTELGNWIQ